jgi:caffeoyl-CoA O-methyltransferase
VSKGDATWWPEMGDHDWIESIAAPVHPVLLEMEAAAATPRIPILDRASGRVLAILASGRRRIAEVGTAIGYSTLWMALAQPTEGTIVTIDPDEGRTTRARGFWRAAGVRDGRIEVVSAPALEAFTGGDPRLDGPFDMAFIDALKPEYGAYLEHLVPRLAPGAIVAADNVLWSGRTSGVRDSRPGDPSVTALRAFCTSVMGDPRFRSTILPVGDGLLVATYLGAAG